MTTFAHALVDSLDTRWAEINLLIAEADSRRSDVDFYNALCRSVSVLMVAQFEGFMNDVAKAALDDINSFGSFKQSPLALKQTFCRSFLEKEDEANNKSLQGRIQKLISAFDDLETRFAIDPFLTKDAQGNNKNPSPSVIEKITGNFGVKDFFKLIDGSDLDAVFKDTASEINDLKTDLKNYVTAGVKEYPYTIAVTVFNISIDIVSTEASSGKKRTFWQEFFDNILSKRHSVAHGATSDNPSSVEEIKTSLLKLEILQLAILAIICERSLPSTMKPAIE